ncbi:MAG: hypothetical protein NV1_42 [Nanoarchaeotal virus 1]|nr:MAG: hypothetical protein NV1_42 [Nanoarchaeotal virus 1]
MPELSFLPVEDIRYQLLPEIIRLLADVGNTSNLRVSSSYMILDREYLKKVRALITNVYLYISSAKVTDDISKRKLLDEMSQELLAYDDYIRWGRVDYRVLMYILSRIMEILNSVTGTYGVKANPYGEEAERPSGKQTRNLRILG